jgi:hypothetical protein
MVTNVIGTVKHAVKQGIKRGVPHIGVLGNGRTEDATRWRFVTVARPPEDVLPGGKPPGPLAAWQDAIEVLALPAPGGRGTELGARLRDPRSAQVPVGLDDLDGETPVQKLRSALRRSKQLLETGEVLRATEPGTTQPTVTNAPLRSAITNSGGEGRL